MTPFVQAKRIWSAHDTRPNQYVGFRTRFSMEALPQKAFLRIRADNRYSITLNGKWIAAQQYSDYDFAPVYDEIEVSSWLCIGENTLEILGYCQNETSAIYRRGEPSLIFELCADGVIVTASGKDTLVTTDTGFQSGEVEKTSHQLGYSFRYNAKDAQEPVYLPATLLSEREMDYRLRPIPQLTVGDPLPARIAAQGIFIKSGETESGKAIMSDFLSARPFKNMSADENALPSDNGITLSAEDGDGIYAVIDLGSENAGYLLLDALVEEDTRITCGYGEHLDDLRVRAAIDGRNFAFEIHATKGRNTLFYPIKRIGCRYLQIHAACKKITLYYAGLRPVNYPYPETRIPDGLNLLQRRIYDTAVKTLRLCSHEHYEDTPWREQALYAMDSRNQMLFSYDAFGETNFAKENLRLMAQGQKASGLIELCSPAELDDSINIPCFSLVWITALHEYFERTQDVEFVKEMLPCASRILNFFAELSTEDGLVKNRRGFWHFYEWAPMMTGRSNACDAPLNAFHLMALRAYKNLSEAVGTSSDGMEAKIQAIEDAYVRAFYSEEKQAYRLSTYEDRLEIYPELVQALTVLAGVCKDPDQKKDLLRRMAGGEFSPTTTLSHRIYCYQALSTCPEMKEAIVRDVDARWFEMLAKGATSFWETERGADDFDLAGSLCHGWSAVPIWVYWNCL